MIILGIFDSKTIQDNWESNVIIYLLVLIICIFFNSLSYVLGKKALFSEFLSPQSILSYIGLYQLLLSILFSIPFMFIKIDISGKKDNVFKIFRDALNNWKNIIFCLLYMVTECTYELFLWIIIDRFLPNDLAIALIIKGLAVKIFDFGNEYLIKKEGDHLTKTIIEFIIYILLIISTSIHSEIIIINICQLNSYTKKNLRDMSNEDYILSKPQFSPINMEFEEEEEEEDELEEKMEKKIIFELSKK